MGFRENVPTLAELRAEAPHVYKMLLPMIFANLLSMASSLITTEWMGRMGETELAGSALGSMTVSISLSVAIGLITAVDTLASQAHGAGNDARVGVVMQRGMVVVAIYGVPLAALWWFIEPILILAQQPPAVAHLAAQYTRCVSLAIIPGFFSQVVGHALLASGRAIPTFVFMTAQTATVALCAWLNVSVIGLQFLGPPLALCAGWAVGLPAVLAFSSLTGAFDSVWTGFTKDAFHELKPFLGLAVPGILMTCADWIAFEVCALIAGAVDQQELAAFSLLYQTMGLMFMFPMSFGICASARVGNALGAGKPRAARAVIVVAIGSSVCCASVYLTVVGCLRKNWGYVFTNQDSVVRTVADGVPVLCIMEAMDAIQAVESGIMRGAGMQKMGALCNFVFYYIVGLPLAAVAAIYLDWGAKGIFSALSCGVALQLITFTTRLATLDWDKMAKEVSEREAKRLLLAKQGQKNIESAVSPTKSVNEESALLRSDSS